VGVLVALFLLLQAFGVLYQIIPLTFKGDDGSSAGKVGQIIGKALLFGSDLLLGQSLHLYEGNLVELVVIIDLLH